jgi:hypothetical protein
MWHYTLSGRALKQTPFDGFQIISRDARGVWNDRDIISGGFARAGREACAYRVGTISPHPEIATRSLAMTSETKASTLACIKVPGKGPLLSPFAAMTIGGNEFAEPGKTNPRYGLPFDIRI